MKRRRFFAVTVALAVVFSLLFSVIFPSAQANHVHENEETCTICATIQDCNELFRALSTALSSDEEQETPETRFLGKDERRQRAFSARRVTPVSLKVKLIN